MSLRGRLLLVAAAMVALALIVVDLATYSQLRSNLYTQVDTRLESAGRTVDSLTRQPVAVIGGFVQARDADDTVQYSEPQGGDGPDLPAYITGFKPSSNSQEPETYFTAPSTDPHGPSFRVRASRYSDGSELIIALPLDQVSKTLQHQARTDLAVTILALLGVIGLGWGLVRFSLRPLEKMEETAAAIAEGDLARRVPGDAEPTEVGRLARTLNLMLTRIQDAFAARDATEHQLRQSEERLRRFVADASHELRTPVAAVQAYAELFERGAASRPEDLARVLSGIRSETARMGELVEDLLLLARLDEGRPLEQESVELVGLVAEAVGAAAAVGPEWPVRLDASHTVEVTGDAARLRQVVDNLLANVRAHTPQGTTTMVRVGARDTSGVIEVADNGPGFPADTGSRVFERFYRADPSRSRQNGGAGLGLAIVAAIVAAHGGAVAATATPAGGATFTVWLPARPAAAPATESATAAFSLGPTVPPSAPAAPVVLSASPPAIPPAVPPSAGASVADAAAAPAIASNQ